MTEESNEVNASAHLKREDVSDDVVEGSEMTQEEIDAQIEEINAALDQPFIDVPLGADGLPDLRLLGGGAQTPEEAAEMEANVAEMSEHMVQQMVAQYEGIGIDRDNPKHMKLLTELQQKMAANAQTEAHLANLGIQMVPDLADRVKFEVLFRMVLGDDPKHQLKFDIKVQDRFREIMDMALNDLPSVTAPKLQVAQNLPPGGFPPLR